MNCHEGHHPALPADEGELTFWSVLASGLYKQNAILRQMLGLCATLAVSTTVFSSLAMGAATTAVLIASSVIISMIRKWIPENVRLPLKIVVIASAVTIVERLMFAYAIEAHHVLGVYLPLIVVNCLILGRAEVFARKNPVRLAFADAVGMGLGFSIALIAVGVIREIIGGGKLLGFSIFWPGFEPALLFAFPAGAFFVVGLVLAASKWWDSTRDRAEERSRVLKAAEEVRTS